MKINYLSDIHMDFHVPFQKNQEKWEQRTREWIRDKIENHTKDKQELVAIAGDISHYNNQSYWVIDEFRKQYDFVFVTLGNHDYYLVSKNQQKKYKNSSFFRTMELIEWFKGSNVYINTPMIGLSGKVIQLLPMWYPIETDSQLNFFHNISNDSKYIKGIDIHAEYLDQKELVKEVDLLVTHTPIIQVPSHDKFKRSDCYLAPVDILPKNVIMVTHESLHIYKYGTQFAMNCWGYEDYGFEIKTLELV